MTDKQQAPDERERFEAWAAPILSDNPTWRESAPCELAWQAWQAALATPPAAPEREAAEPWTKELGIPKQWGPATPPVEREALVAFDEAVQAELPRVSHVQYDSHEICKHFASKVRERIAVLAAAAPDATKQPLGASASPTALSAPAANAASAPIAGAGGLAEFFRLVVSALNVANGGNDWQMDATPAELGPMAAAAIAVMHDQMLSARDQVRSTETEGLGPQGDEPGPKDAPNTNEAPPTADERAAAAAECKRLVGEYGDSCRTLGFVESRSCDRGIRSLEDANKVWEALDAAIDRLAGKP